MNCYPNIFLFNRSFAGFIVALHCAHGWCFSEIFMPLFIASLNSGSNGNCYYIGNETEAIFIDAGLSCRETERRMKRLGLKMDKVKAIFISHEHTDHIAGMPGIARKYELPVYITPHTLQNCRLQPDAHLTVTFKAYEPVTVGNLTVHPFPKKHDGKDPHSFNVCGNGVTIGVYTDIGAPCRHLAAHFKECHAAFLEANYDSIMLEQGRYPHHLKRRISGGYGHLSNSEALDFFKAHRPAFMSHLLLAHLSQDNNHPDLALQLFQQHAGNTEVVVASRYKESAVYTIHGGSKPVAVQPRKQAIAALKEQQLKLF